MVDDKLTFQDNTYFITPNDDPKDRIQIEIGDSKDPTTFHPQIKIKRWDNEVNASFRLIDTEPETLTTEGDKIKLIGATKEVHFYELTESKDLRGGGYELEVILKERPPKNTLEFSIESKGLDFFYQPELTQKQKDEGSNRPENVVDSYVVYHNGNPSNYKGGKEYKAGKAFHIYRPKIKDAKGNWVWGELNIANGIMTVTIPQEFLDTAVYPVRHAAGATFGYTTAGGSSTTITSQYSFGGSTFTGAAGTVDSLSAYYSCPAPTTGLGMFKHSDLTFVDGNDWGGPAQGSAGWVTETDGITGATLSAIDYLIGAGNENTDMELFYDSGDTNQGHIATSDAHDGSFGWNASINASHNNNKYSVYCTYAPAAAEGPSIVGWKTLLGVGQG